MENDREGIAPALPALEWKKLARFHHHAVRIVDTLKMRYDFEIGATAWRSLDPDLPHDVTATAVEKDEHKRRLAAIAMLNDLLPDDDLRKITREKVDRLRFLCGAFEADDAVHSWLPAFADALESYLPPE